jgi:hypothetical protein
MFLFKGIIKKYSNFVGSPIFLNGKQANTIQVSDSYCLISFAVQMPVYYAFPYNICSMSLAVLHFTVLLSNSILDESALSVSCVSTAESRSCRCRKWSTGGRG